MSQNREIDVLLFASLDYFEKVGSGDNTGNLRTRGPCREL